MLLKLITGLSLLLAVLGGVSGNFFLIPVYFIGHFVALFCLAILYCIVICAFVKMDEPAETDSPFYRANMYLYVEFLMNVLRVKVTATGLEKTPKEGRFLLVCNHQHMADPGILLHFFKGSQLAFISKKENEKLPIINKFLHKCLCQSIERGNDRQGLRVILKCIQLIKEDQVSIAVFPEGGTHHDQLIHPLRPGAFKIAQKAKVPIVVCTLDGTESLFRNLKTYKQTPVRLNLVDVIPAQELEGQTTTQIADRVYQMMIADLGEEFKAEEECL